MGDKRAEDRTFDLRDNNGNSIECGLVSYPFAEYRALYWSRSVGTTVNIVETTPPYDEFKSGVGGSGKNVASIRTDHMSKADYVISRYENAVDRLKQAKAILEARESEIVTLRLGVNDMLDAAIRLREVADTHALVELLESAAMKAETAQWTVLVDDESASAMLGAYPA